MFEEMCRQILNAGVSAAGKYSDTISTTAVALSFIMSLVRVAYMAYERGIDQWSTYAKKQLGLFFIVVAMCFPIGFSGGSFISSFPKLIIEAGLSGINSNDNVKAFTAKSYEGGIAKKLKDEMGGEDNSKIIKDTLSKVVLATQEGTTLAYQKADGLPIHQLFTLLKFLIIAILVFFPIGLMTVPLLFLNAWVGIATIAAELAVCVVMSLGMVYPFEIPEIQAALTGATYLLDALGNFVKAVVKEVGFTMFYTALTFGFFGTLISVALKSAVFCATFPISVVNLAFEKQTSVFIQNVVKIFSLAITPFILITTLDILMTGFGIIAGKDGLLYTIIESYVMANYNVGVIAGGGSIIDGAIEAYSLIARMLIACFLSPTILCIPAISIMMQAHKIASELLGAGVGYATGLSQGFSRAGGMGRGMGGGGM